MVGGEPELPPWALHVEAQNAGPPALRRRGRWILAAALGVLTTLTVVALVWMFLPE